MGVYVQHRHRHTEKISRHMLRAIGALLVFTLAGVTWMRLAGVEPTAQPPADVAALHRVEAVFVEERAGGVRLLDPGSGETLTALAAGEDGFVRGILRVLARKRMQYGVAADGPVELIRWEDGRLSLRDPSTQWAIELRGFGRDNLAVFARLMSALVDTEEGNP